MHWDELSDDNKLSLIKSDEKTFQGNIDEYFQQIMKLREAIKTDTSISQLNVNQQLIDEAKNRIKKNNEEVERLMSDIDTHYKWLKGRREEFWEITHRNKL